MVRYPFDVLRAVSKVEPLTTNGKSDTYGLSHPFALRYRRVNGTFYELIKDDAFVKSPKTPFSVIPVKTGIQEIQEVLDSRSPPARGQASRE
jgi:hypothetical protein